MTSGNQFLLGLVAEDEGAEDVCFEDPVIDRKKDRKKENRFLAKFAWNNGVRTGKQAHMIPMLSSAVL